MDKWTIITGLISALSGGSLGAWLTYKSKSRQQDANDFDILISKYHTLIDKFEKRIEILENKVENMRKREEQLLLQVAELQGELAKK